jgi:capsular polysaccharide biosynthesis protein
VEANHQLSIKPLNNFVADISQGRAWIIPQQSYWQLCHAIAIITPDNYLLADLSRDYPAPLPPCDQHNPAHHQIFSMESLPPLEKIEGKVAVLSTLSGNVYFHWMIDLLPRIEILRRSLIDLAEIDWFVVNSHNLPFQKETLNILGVPAHKILTSDQHPHIQADHLIVPSFANYLGYLPDWGIQFLRETFMTADVLKRTGWPKRIYINRDGAKYRQVLNEEALVKYLEKYGFVSVALETLTLADQIALFAEAEVIITPHGSGLTNTVFCQPGTKIVELFSPHYMRYYYVNISRSLGLKHYYWLGDSTSCYPLRKLMYQNPLTEDIIVDLSSLATVLKMVLE